MWKSGNLVCEALISFIFYREARSIANLEMLKGDYIEIIRYLPSIMAATFVDVVINSVKKFIKNQGKGSTKNGAEKDINLNLQLLLQKI